MKRVALIDYGVGNIASIALALQRVGAFVEIVRDPASASQISSSCLVLPGQGTFAAAVRWLERGGVRLVERLLERGASLLGICLGLQLLFEESEEGPGRGLGLLRGRVARLPRGCKRIHIGWSAIEVVRRDCPLLEGIESGQMFYFAHSYRAHAEDPEHVAATTSYCGVEFPSVIWKGSIYGTQFHPEKSGSIGLRLLENFAELCGDDA
ncbi:MAG: imidazole glycerol phosphate synthase subunit HisH [Fervidicoccaceae archaeon]